MTIRCIMQATITKHKPYGDTTARVSWLDTHKHPHEISGQPQGRHMRDLLLRAMREGVTVTREEF